MIRFASAALVAALIAAPAFAAPEKYTLDPSHSQIVFSYNHLGFSTNYGMFSGFEGKISYDAENPAASSVTVGLRMSVLVTRVKNSPSKSFVPDLVAATMAAEPTWSNSAL